MGLPQIYRPVLFYLLTGLMVPQYSDIWYYFTLEVLQLSKFVLGMLGVVAFITLMIGTALFSKFFADKETRSLLRAGILINFVGAAFGVALALRFNIMIGISDVAFVMFTNIVTETLSMGLLLLPSLILFAKITPMYIEATVYAILTGLYNFTRQVVSAWVGVLINSLFVGITNANLENFYILVLTELFLSPLPLLILHLIPTRKEIAELQHKEEEHTAKLKSLMKEDNHEAKEFDDELKQKLIYNDKK